MIILHLQLLKNSSDPEMGSPGPEADIDTDDLNITPTGDRTTPTGERITPTGGRSGRNTPSGDVRTILTPTGDYLDREELERQVEKVKGRQV